MRVVLCGSIHWTYSNLVYREIDRLHKEAKKSRSRLLIINGGEPGPEAAANYYCHKLGIDIIIHEAVKARGEGCYFRRK